MLAGCGQQAIEGLVGTLPALLKHSWQHEAEYNKLRTRSLRMDGRPLLSGRRVDVRATPQRGPDDAGDVGRGINITGTGVQGCGPHLFICAAVGTDDAGRGKILR